MRLPHIYRFYLSLTSPRRVGVRVLACTARRGGERGGIRGGGGRRENPGENLWNAGGKKENIGRNDRRKESKPRADPSYGICFYLESEIYLITSIIPTVLS